MARTNRADRVLLIDDDRMSRDVLALLLETEGYEVCAAESGESALALLRETSAQVPVVLMDVQMPGLSGEALSSALREVCGAGTVLLAMSGSEVPEDLEDVFDGFLLKPFHARDLAKVVEHCRSESRRRMDGEPDDSRAALPAANASKERMQYQQTDGAAGTAVVSAGTLLDERIYSQLNEAMPGVQVRQMYGMCLEDVRRRIGDMRRLAASSDGEQFARQAHAIKGGCGMLGASELYRMAADLEKAGLGAAGLEGNPGVNPLDELAAACDRLERILGTRA